MFFECMKEMPIVVSEEKENKNIISSTVEERKWRKFYR